MFFLKIIFFMYLFIYLFIYDDFMFNLKTICK
jgi:hypothetical protein